MSYSKLTNKYIPVSSYNYGSRNGVKIDTITIHHMAGNLSLQACHDCWNGKQVSTNYGIDSNGQIGCFLDEEYRSFASASGDNDRRAITIEVANDVPSNAGGWHCSDAAINSLINLLVDICQRYNIPKLLWQNNKNLIGQVELQNITIHQWFYSTLCPGPYLLSKMGEIANRVNVKLGAAAVPNAEGLTDKQFATMFSEMRREIQCEVPGSWSNEARTWAINNKIFSGNSSGEYMWKDFCSREQMAALLKNFSTNINTTSTNIKPSPKTDEEIIWDFLFEKLGNKYAAAGVMGNLYAESGLIPNNLQNTYNRSLNISDEDYTAKVDSGKYTNFIKDSAGYGLAQWTYWSRKQNLLNYAKEKKVSIGNLQMQLEFLYKELTSYGLISKLQSAKNVKAASDIILLQFERPLDQSTAVQKKRAEFGQVYLERYGK